MLAFSVLKIVHYVMYSGNWIDLARRDAAHLQTMYAGNRWECEHELIRYP